MELLRETESEADAAASMRLVDALKAGACDDDVLSIITPAHAAYRDRRGRMMLHKTSFYNASVAVVQALIIANPSACSSATVTWAGFLCTSLPAPWPLPATSCRPRCAPWPCPRCQRNLPHGPCGATRRGRARRWPRTPSGVYFLACVPGPPCCGAGPAGPMPAQVMPSLVGFQVFLSGSAQSAVTRKWKRPARRMWCRPSPPFCCSRRTCSTNLSQMPPHHLLCSHGLPTGAWHSLHISATRCKPSIHVDFMDLTTELLCHCLRSSGWNCWTMSLCA